MLRRTLLIGVITACLGTAVSAQVSSTASIPIVARIPGSISLSLRSTPVTVTVQGGAQQEFNIPLTVQWNLDPRETPGFRVMAYFRDPGSALVDPVGATSVPASDVLARWGHTPFQPLDANDSAFTLFRTSVLPDRRRGNESQILELKIADPAVITLPDGAYQGVLYLEVRNF